MSTRWSLNALQKWIEANHPPESAALELVKSMSRSSGILAYHVIQVRDAFKPFTSDDGDKQKIFAAMMGFDEEFSRAALANEANLIACIHTVRNYADIFAQLVNVLALPTPLDAWECSFEEVTKKLPQSPLKQQLSAVTTSHWFKYLAAFSNMSKHRQLVRYAPTISFLEDRTGARVQAFEFRPAGKKAVAVQYPSYWGEEVLEGAYSVFRELLACGQELNRQVIGA